MMTVVMRSKSKNKGAPMMKATKTIKGTSRIRVNCNDGDTIRESPHQRMQPLLSDVLSIDSRASLLKQKSALELRLRLLKKSHPQMSRTIR